VSVLLLATRSAGKLRELLPLLERAGFAGETLVDAGLPEEPGEDAIEAFETFEANALAKARWFAERAPGRVVLADDSGLTVDALGGGPGVHSKRWANADPALAGAALDGCNNRFLLEHLSAFPRETQRAGGYVCVAAAAWDDRSLVARGETRGVILPSPRGAGGFGYDPLFASDDLGGRTFAEATVAEKERVSHRGRAFRRLLARLAGLPTRTAKSDKAG